MEYKEIHLENEVYNRNKQIKETKLTEKQLRDQIFDLWKRAVEKPREFQRSTEELILIAYRNNPKCMGYTSWKPQSTIKKNIIQILEPVKCN